LAADGFISLILLQFPLKVGDGLADALLQIHLRTPSENGLSNLNRKCTLEMILNALRILNDFDIHVAYNLLMFEPDTVMSDILTNLRFIERHIDNPFNFCRAELTPARASKKSCSLKTACWATISDSTIGSKTQIRGISPNSQLCLL
jgi:hypothetical protein